MIDGSTDWELFHKEDTKIVVYLDRTVRILGQRLRASFEGRRSLTVLDRLEIPLTFQVPTRRGTAGLAGAAILGCTALVVSVWHLDLKPPEEAIRLVIEDGDTVTGLFARAGLSDGEVLAVMEAGRGTAFGLVPVPGGEIRITRRDDGRLIRLTVDQGDRGVAEFVAGGDHLFTITQPVFPSPGHDAGAAPPLSGGLLAEDTQDRPDVPASSPQATAENITARIDAPPSPRIAENRSIPPADASPLSEPAESMQSVKVRDGDSLYLIFKRNGLSQTDLAALLASGESGRKLKHLQPGQSIAFRVGGDGRLAQFDHEVDELSTVRFVQGGNGFAVETISRDYDRRVTAKSGIIESSLFAATDEVEIPYQAADTLVEVLGWDIDFARDLRKGDSFSILYEELRVDDRLVRTGDVLALEFRSKRAGKPIRAFRYTDANGDTDYFAPDGRSLRRAFTRNPLPVNRISSRFSTKRRHPVLNTIRAHRGVDYAAPRGTPIKATGDGQVTFVGRKGSYGKTVILSHGNRYSTLYAHLSRYDKRTKKGARIRQDEVIGYVGATGLASGPHLHYEFRIQGVHQDPLTVELPRAAPLGKSERERFLRAIEPVASRLDTLGATRLASLDR